MADKKNHGDRCCGASRTKCPHEYELVRTNKETGEKRRIRFSGLALSLLDVTKDEWR